MSNQKETKLFQNYKSLYLVGLNEIGDQELIIFRYREALGIPVIQLVHKSINLDFETITRYSDIAVSHSDNYIIGGVPNVMGYSSTLPKFTYNRKTLELIFDFDDRHASCKVFTDTATPFIRLIERM